MQSEGTKLGWAEDFKQTLRGGSPDWALRVKEGRNSGMRDVRVRILIIVVRSGQVRSGHRHRSSMSADQEVDLFPLSSWRLSL